ncbi:ADP-ribosylglycohydrolase family protein [Streptomyces sp. HD]|uniref:ADP-ribosylglycohydrolase family protein n=1 Tax=Streptomyces sp. HD TaxID=3020892 RepID=UPI003FA7193B
MLPPGPQQGAHALLGGGGGGDGRRVGGRDKGHEYDRSRGARRTNEPWPPRGGSSPRPPSVADALPPAVNHCGDSDSTGSVRGNLPGARYGDHGLPREWPERVEGRSRIAALADDPAAAGVRGRPSGNPSDQDRRASAVAG